MPLLTLVTEQCLAPVPGGTGRYTREIGRALVGSAPGDWQLRGVTAWHRDVRAARISGVAGPRRLPLPRRALPLAWQLGLPPFVGGDVVHATTPLAPLPRLAPPGGPAVVVTVHDAVPYTHPELLTPRGVTWHRAMIAAAASRAAAVVVPTHAVAAELQRHVEVRRLEVIGEGVAEVFIDAPSPTVVAAVRRRLGLPERYLVAVGTLEPRKGLPTVIRALAHLPRDVHLAVVGPPGWGDALPAEGSDRVHLLGRLSDADLAAVVTGATVSVHASRSEGFGLPLAEAMSVGTPVVHTDIPVFAEVSRGAGVAFPVDDDAALAVALTALLNDDDARRRAITAGREAARHHRWEVAAEQLWRLYEELATAR